MAAKAKIPASVGSRHDRRIEEYQHDTYKRRGKLKKPTVCPKCGLLFHKGRWTWGAKPAEADETTCPACLRIRVNYPKGIVTLSGPFVEKHYEQVMGIVRNTERKEKKEHPLSRLMSIDRRQEGLVIFTTDTHLPRRIGEALQRAHRGQLELHYDHNEDFLRAHWTNHQPGEAK